MGATPLQCNASGGYPERIKTLAAKLRMQQYAIIGMVGFPMRRGAVLRAPNNARGDRRAMRLKIILSEYAFASERRLLLCSEALNDPEAPKL